MKVYLLNYNCDFVVIPTCTFNRLFIGVYTVKATAEKACEQQPYIYQCCDQSPCAYGGTCTEMCENAIYKFNCTCAMGYFGRATSCKEFLQRDDGTDLSIVRWL